MKRSNLFLAATTGLLAIASFAFAKSHKESKSGIQGYCLTSGGVHCPTQTVRFVATTALSSAAKWKCPGHPSETAVTALCAKALRTFAD
jgi:hypothetical protein